MGCVDGWMEWRFGRSWCVFVFEGCKGTKGSLLCYAVSLIFVGRGVSRGGVVSVMVLKCGKKIEGER